MRRRRWERGESDDSERITGATERQTGERGGAAAAGDARENDGGGWIVRERWLIQVDEITLRSLRLTVREMSRRRVSSFGL